MNPLKRTGPIENPFESASHLKKVDLKKLKVPSPVIYQNWESENASDYILMRDGSEISLTQLAHGNFHKVYTMPEQPDRLIKAPIGSINDNDKKGAFLESARAYKKLEDHPDLRPCQIFNDFLTDGYYEVEYVKESFDLKDLESLAPIRHIIAEMVVDPDQYFIHDFFPRNVRKGEEGEVVVIDLADRDYKIGGVEEEEKNLNLEDLAEDISKFILKWSDGDKESLERFMNEIKNRNQGQELLEKVSKRISEEI